MDQVPTGVVADVYSRRLSIIVGTIMIGLGFAFEGSTPHFWAVLVAQVIWGVGATFTSMATEAWISDEVGGERAGQAAAAGAEPALHGVGQSAAGPERAADHSICTSSSTAQTSCACPRACAAAASSVGRVAAAGAMCRRYSS